MILDASFDPGDNKLRLRASARLPRELYDRVRAAGFIWAPKQDLFVAPMWTPAREDLLLELCGEIGDEDASLVRRAEDRSERFEGYRENRAADAEGARNAVAAIADNIPLGQPILVGHHSERHARKDAERIESGMRKAVKMWETSEYWKRRAAGAIASAKYKELPAVRARRIKGIEADKRKEERAIAEALRFLDAWQTAGLTPARASMIAGEDRIHRCFTLAEYPRDLPVSQYEGDMSLWSALDHGIITAEQARDLATPIHHATIARAERWIAHYDNRLIYERTMLEDSGYVAPPKPMTKAALPLLNYSGDVAYRNPYNREIVRTVAVGISKAELAKIHADYKGTRVSECGTHRVRMAMLRRGGGGHEYSIVYLTDSKQHARPGAEAVKAKASQEASAVDAIVAAKVAQAAKRAAARAAAPAPPPIAAEVQAMRQSLKAGVRAVSVPQSFPTPPELAARMVEAAEIGSTHRVLEPSAGTGNILRALRASGVDPAYVMAVEINRDLANILGGLDLADLVIAGDFLRDPEILCDPNLGTFDRILMNPPFSNGQDTAHIKHALSKLRPGGRLVAICADGPRQFKELRPLVAAGNGSWECLPNDTFISQGTSVRTSMIIINAPANKETA